MSRILVATLATLVHGDGTICSQGLSYSGLCDGTYSGADLDLNGHSISGTIPTEIGLLTKLSWRLSLHENSLSGTIPTQIGQLSKLAYGL
mmetsp:Transcript_12532/g.28591  ORF Transcript_12532/g.28591 Transcript_12532/m.28591 type:complete len:90 (-) Transcript_12532:10-279(-)